MGDEIELNFKHSLGVGNRRGGQTASAHVESRSPKMVDGWAQRQTDFAHDLGPHVQSGIRVLPFGEWKCGPVVRLLHANSSCSGTNHALAFDFPEALLKLGAPRQIAFIENSHRVRVYIIPRLQGLSAVRGVSFWRMTSSPQLIRDSDLWILARWMQKVFSSSDALGHRADLSCAWRDSAVARARTHEKTHGDAAGHDGIATFPGPGCHGGALRRVSLSRICDGRVGALGIAGLGRGPPFVHL